MVFADHNMGALLKLAVLLLVLVGLLVGPPVEKEKKEMTDNMKYNTEGLTKEQAQDQEYFRYLTQVVGELEKDPEFKKRLDNATEDDIRSGKIADHFPAIGSSIRRKLDEIKRMEIEYQRDLLRQKKDHMAGIERNYWNPIHHGNQEKFEVEDLKKLLSKHNEMMKEQDSKRKEEFKTHEMQKEHDRQEKRKNMTEAERKEEEEVYKAHHGTQKHDKMHEPGHKKELEEVWEKQDGLDADNFDPRTFFNMHDKNGDGHLDMYELETFFLSDLDKVYNESDPNVDPTERNEEMARMREHVMKNMDKNKDGLVSYEEFMSETKDDDFNKDEEWKPLTEQEQYTNEELKEYEKQLAKGEHNERGEAVDPAAHNPPPHP